MNKYLWVLAITTLFFACKDTAKTNAESTTETEVNPTETKKELTTAEAIAYKNKVVPEAHGEAAKITEAAEAYKSRIVAEAEGEAERFKKIYAEYKLAPELTRKRLYIEMMERVFSGTDKVIIDNNGGAGSVVPYLPLNELQKKK